MFYLEVFFLALLLSFLFALWGVGFAVVFVPLLNMLGINLNLAKAVWLFTNSVSTWISAFMNFKRGVLDYKFWILLWLFSIAWTIVWSYFSKFIDPKIIKILFVILLFFALFMMFYKSSLKKEAQSNKKHSFNYKIGIWWFVIGVLSWMLWIWWWMFLIPFLVFLWYDYKFITTNISLVIFLSTLSWFFTYMTFVNIDYILLGVSSVWALLGWYLGNWVMHYKLDKEKIRYILAILILLVAIKLTLSLF